MRGLQSSEIRASINRAGGVSSGSRLRLTDSHQSRLTKGSKAA